MKPIISLNLIIFLLIFLFSFSCAEDVCEFCEDAGKDMFNTTATNGDHCNNVIEDFYKKSHLQQAIGWR